jgi:ubiquinone biosynthesis protein
MLVRGARIGGLLLATIARTVGGWLWDILRIVARAGRVDVLLFAAVLQWLWATLQLRVGAIHSDPRPRILRRFLERAGGTWIKLGQILAMRSDFLPQNVIDELVSLLDQVPPFSYDIAQKTVEGDLGRPLTAAFAEFPASPIASASFGQVYRAVLPTGEVVAVKVMRPGLRTIIMSDTIQLRILAFFIDTFGLLGSIRLNPQVDQLAKVLHEEIDYHFEADNLRRAVQTSRYVPIMKIPRTVDHLCTSHVLTMEYLSGIWMNTILRAIRDGDQSKLEDLAHAGLQRKLVAERMYRIGLRQLFEVGTFHADPHAANIVVLEDNVVGYVDFGIVGQMDPELADSQSRYLKAVKDGRIDDAAEALTESVVIPEHVQSHLSEFRANLANQVRDWLARVGNPETSLRQRSIAQLLLQNIQLVRQYGFELRENTMRYYRALIIADVIVLQLDPDFDTVGSLRRYFRNRTVRRLRTEATYPNLASVAADYFDLWLAGPRLADQFSRGLRRYEARYNIVEAQYDVFWRAVATVSVILLAVVLVARLFGYTDVGMLIGFPISLNWLWFAPALLAVWRIAAVQAR